MATRLSSPVFSRFSHAVRAAGLACCGALASWAQAEPEPPILASVNGQAVTAVEVREMAMKNNRPIGRPDGFAEALSDAVNFEILAVEAMKLGYDEAPEIQKLVKSMAVQRLLRDKVGAPASAGAAPATSPSGITVSEEEVKALYDETRSEYTQPTLVRGQVLFLRERKGSKTELKRTLADVQADIKAGSAFGSLVTKYSDNPADQARAGMTQWMAEGQDDKLLPSAVTAALFAAKDPLAVTGPIMAGQGVYFVKLAERREGKTLALDEVRRVLHERVYRKKATAAYEQFVATLSGTVTIERHQEAIDALQKALGEEAGGPPAGPVTIQPSRQPVVAPPPPKAQRPQGNPKPAPKSK